jgi:tetratricopeptide (TPR) repeat protein
LIPPSNLEVEARAAVFAGQLVVFSGRLATLSRKDAHARVQQLGGAWADEVTSRTTMVVIGAASYGPGRARDASGDDAQQEQSRKLRRAQAVNARLPGQIAILNESDFCELAGLPSPDRLAQQFYSLRDIRGMYPAIREDHLRYLEKLGLIGPVVRAHAATYLSFQDLHVIKQAAAEVERGATFRAVLRSLVAARDGQLAFDFRSEAHAAKVIALERPARPAAAPTSTPEKQRSLAADCFLEASELDDGDESRQEDAAAAYRKALLLDPLLVPALVNLANIHYARDQAIEAQALYERAISLDPECFEAHFNLGNILHDLRRYPEALVCYRDALALNPAYADAHFYLAVTLEKMGYSQDAKPHWRAYQQLAPDGEWVELAREFSE